jgi:hypothetical protein
MAPTTAMNRVAGTMSSSERLEIRIATAEHPNAMSHRPLDTCATRKASEGRSSRSRNPHAETTNAPVTKTATIVALMVPAVASMWTSDRLERSPAASHRRAGWLHYPAIRGGVYLSFSDGGP